MSSRDKINKTPEVEAVYAKFSQIRKRQLFRHIKSGVEYVFDGLKTFKFDGEWYDEVKYYCEHDSIPRPEYGRTILNFDKSFEIIENQYSYN